MEFPEMTKICATALMLSVLITACAKPPSQTDLSKTAAENSLGYGSKFTTINGLSFHYVEQGRGDLMLFLHGFPYFGASWDKLLTPFSANYHVVAPDNRGYAYTEKPEKSSDYRIELLVDDVRQLVTKLSPGKPVILVGHDWGGSLAWGLAQTHPELISKLIIINAPPANVLLKMLKESPSQAAASSYVGKLDNWITKLIFTIKGPELLWRGLAHLEEQGYVDEQFKSAFMEAWLQPGAAQAAVNWYTANIPKFDDINEEDYWPSADARITVPSLLIWSSRDKAFALDTFNAIPAYVDTLSVKVIDTDSHAPFIDHTEQVIGHINEFLRQ
jgi:pimeloyl-ACP methyl ester carboxylesterase